MTRIESGRLRHIVAAHLSEENNRPALAGRALAAALNCADEWVAIAGQAERFDLYGRLHHRVFPGGRWLRTPALVLGMLWYRLRDLL